MSVELKQAAAAVTDSHPDSIEASGPSAVAHAHHYHLNPNLQTALLLIDVQKAFMPGHEEANKLGDCEPISETFRRIDSLVAQLTSSPPQAQPIILPTLVPYPPPQMEFPYNLSRYLAGKLVMHKTADSIVEGCHGFRGWLEEQYAKGLRQIVIAGVTTTTCVRASAISIAKLAQELHYSDLRLIVDLSLCGARQLNHESHLSILDWSLMKIHGSSKCQQHSSVELACEQMKEQKCIVVDKVDWETWIRERKERVKSEGVRNEAVAHESQQTNLKHDHDDHDHDHDTHVEGSESESKVQDSSDTRGKLKDDQKEQAHATKADLEIRW